MKPIRFKTIKNGIIALVMFSIYMLFSTNTLAQDIMAEITPEAALTGSYADPSNNIVLTEGYYIINFNTATLGAIKRVEIEFPAGYDLNLPLDFKPHLLVQLGIGGGSLTKDPNNSQKLFFTVTNPLSIPAGRNIKLFISNIKNNSTITLQSVIITTKDSIGNIIDGPTSISDIQLTQVTTPMISDNSITTSKIVDYAVTSTKIAPTAVGPSQLSNDAIWSTHILDGTITSADLSDGTITSVDLSFDPATQAELDTHKGSVDHTGYYTESEISSPGTINSSTSIVEWTKLQNVPPGFADGTDDVGGGASGWTDDGTVVRLTTDTDNVGIGTSIPVNKLHIHNALNNDHLLLSGGAPAIQFSELVAGTERAVIGLSTFPGAFTSSSAVNDLVIRATSDFKQSGGDILFVAGNNWPFFPNGYDDPIEQMRITDGGYVGIGTKQPQAQLHVSKTAAVGPITKSNADIGSINVSGQSAEFGFIKRTLTSWPASPAAGDRFIWYNPDGTARLWTEGNGDLLTVTSAGLVGIGTASPQRTLDVRGLEINTGGNSVNHEAGLSFHNRRVAGFVLNPTQGERWVWYADGTATDGKARLWSGTDKLVVDTLGNVAIGTTDPTDISRGKLVVNGGRLAVNPTSLSSYPSGWGDGIHTWDVYAEGTLGAGRNGTVNGFIDYTGGATVAVLTITSDLSLKKNINTIKDALNKVERLRGVEFEWRREEFPDKGLREGKQIGLIAQEVEEVLPELVSVNSFNGQKSVEYANIVAVLIEAVKELKAQNGELRSRIEAIENR